MERAVARLGVVARHLEASVSSTGTGDGGVSTSQTSSSGSRLGGGSSGGGGSAPGTHGALRMLEGKVAVITGSGQGIGAAAARLFAAHGCAVVVSDLDAQLAERVASDIRAAGGRAIAVPGDVTDPAFPKRLVDATEREYRRLDCLVNNAGYTWDGVLHKMGDRQWGAMLDVHCSAPFRITREAARLMRDAGKREMEAAHRGSGGGGDGGAGGGGGGDGGGAGPSPRCVINVSSVSGTRGSAGQANYSTAKMGVVGLTKTIAHEWGRYGVRCNAIAFGKVATRLVAKKEDGATIKVGGDVVRLGIPAAMNDPALDAMFIPLGRAGTVDEAAGAMLLLASPYASYITGQVLEVNGGAYT